MWICFELYPRWVPLYYLNLLMKLPCMLIKLAGVFLKSLQTGSKQQSISHNDKKEMELS